MGVDVGGTFTDIVVLDEISGDIRVAKVPSTPQDPSIGFTRGIEAITVPLSDVQRVVHGTTVGTNAAIERKGARTAMVTTTGYRDLLEIGRGQRLTGGLFDPKFVRTPPLVPRPLRFEVQERIDASGEVHQPLDEEGVRELGSHLAGLDVEAVSVCLLHSYLNSTHEQRVSELLAKSLPQAFICTSSDVLPEYREYERFSTTVFNGYLGPLMDRYIRRMADWLSSREYGRNLLIMTCNGGMVSAESAIRYPVMTILSGPAAGVSAGIAVAETVGLKNVITYDMGGTSTDVCLVKNLQPSAAPMRVVGGLPLKTPQLDINTVGAGGGSIAWVDNDGSFHVGPQSAGAEPGPACYGRGGESTTVTDANLILNRLSSETRLGGALSMRRELALDAIRSLCEKLAIDDVYRVAEGVVQIAVVNMASAIREVSVERGEDPRDYVLVAMGGAGPMHACPVAEEVGIPRVVIPPYPGNLSALGLLTSNVKHELIRTYLTTLQEIEEKRMHRLFQEMVSEGTKLLEREAILPDQMEFLYSADMRYVGQGHELNVQLTKDDLNPGRLEALFHQAHQERYSYSREGHAVQLASLRVLPVGNVGKLGFQPLESGNRHVNSGAGTSTRNVQFQGVSRSTPVYEREQLQVGQEIEGPAIIEEMGSTTVIFPGWSGKVDGVGNILMISGRHA